MHKLLKRQLNKLYGETLPNIENMEALLHLVDQSYNDFQNEYAALERTANLSENESYKELRNFKEAIDTAALVSISDPNGVIISANPNFCNSCGYELDELIGENHRIISSGYHPNEFWQEVWQTIITGKIWQGEICNRKKSGELFWIDSTIIPFVNEQGIPYQYLSIRFDITEKKESSRLIHLYNQELEKKNKELDQFAYIVSHDLKAPLRGINNLSQWIEEDLEGKIEPDTQKNLDLLRKRVYRMENLIDGILQYSRVGRVKSQSETYEVESQIKEIISTIHPPENYSINIQDGLPIITTEKIALEQVFSNLISNAFKYNYNPAPRLEINCVVNANFYEFCIADNGSGIAAEFHEKIFVIFQTLQARDTFESTGVGLAIVKKLVEEKGGKIWLVSAENEGSKFYFTWPK